MVKRKKIISIIVSALLAFLTFFTCFAPTLVHADDTSSSEEIIYSNVLDDLHKDSSFDETLYPAYTYEEITALEKENPDSAPPLFDVISMAEGERKELFIYVYNPTREDLGMSATQISMYYGYAKNPKEFSPDLYDLHLLSYSGVFDKYLVKGYEVTEDSDRYYNVVELSRPFNLEIDESIENGYTNDKAIAIGKQWYFYYYNNELICEMGKFDVLELKILYNGNIYYKNGFTLGNLVGLEETCNARFIAFNAENYIIKKIFDAELSYDSRLVETYDDYSNGPGVDTTKYIPTEGYTSTKVTLTKDDEVTFNGKGLFSKDYKWNRISSSEEFVKNFEEQGGELSGVVRDELLNAQWVFSFTESIESEDDTKELSADGMTIITTGVTRTYTEVCNVDILRISFLDISRKYYNLGVVVDKTTADNIPDGEAGPDYESWWEKLLAILCLIFFVLLYKTYLAPFVNPIISSIIKLVLKGIGLLVKLAFKIITFPLRLLFRIFGFWER